MTKGTYLVIGLILLGIGFYAYQRGEQTIKEIESLNVFNFPISQYLMQVSPELKSNYNLAQAFYVGGSILMIFGVISIIVSIIPEPKKDKEPSKKENEDAETNKTKDEEGIKVIK